MSGRWAARGLALAALVLGCADGRSYLAVTVRGAARVPSFHHLHVTMHNAGKTSFRVSRTSGPIRARRDRDGKKKKRSPKLCHRT